MFFVCLFVFCGFVQLCIIFLSGILYCKAEKTGLVQRCCVLQRLFPPEKHTAMCLKSAHLMCTSMFSNVWLLFFIGVSMGLLQRSMLLKWCLHADVFFTSLMPCYSCMTSIEHNLKSLTRRKK